MGEPQSPQSVLDLLTYHPGQILMKNERFVLVNANALGTLRQDLLSTLGRDRAKGFLLRYGWSCGYNDALSVKQQYPGYSVYQWLQQGPNLHMLEGVVHVELTKLELDQQTGAFHMEGIWTNSYEVQQHFQHFGLAEDSVCWTLLGYAGGFSTGLFGRQIIYKELSCVGRGDSYCHFLGKTVEEWGDEVLSELPFYSEAKIAEELEEAHDRIQQQHHLLTQIININEQLNRLILAGFDRTVILETIGKMMAAPVILEDRHFKPLAWWLTPDESEGLDAYLIHTQMSKNQNIKKKLQTMKREKAGIDLTVEEDNVTWERSMAPIVLGEEVVGYLSILHSEGTNVELRRMITKRAAAVIGFDLLKEQTALETEHRLKGEFMEELLSGDSPIKSLVNRAHYLGYDLQRHQRFLLISMDRACLENQYEKDEASAIQLRKQLFESARSAANMFAKGSLVVQRPEGIAILIYDDGLSPNTLAQNISRRQKEVLQELTISIFISRKVTSMEDLRTAYNECKNAQQVMSRLGKNELVLSVDEMQVFDLLYAGNAQNSLQAYAARQLKKLIDYDHAHNGQLIQTLYMYLTHECNFQHTARAMNLSLSGLKYRLQRLREVGNVDLENPDTRFDLQLAIRILLTSGTISLNHA
ncbi:XylR N-terminal domain-containing protein [Ferviditalea candida]|uniref:XylR N-terminal domain-containing protein n=1 Tax=Ferviditalea candida TaxID=3108399 RepID=A0ABU5ZN74_9BACL|nr:XylR N-terminal domain-containing protein [Paenibacillaceae bacterium T2]